MYFTLLDYQKETIVMGCTDILVLNKGLSLMKGDRNGGTGKEGWGEGMGVTRRKETIVTERCGGCVDILVLKKGLGFMKEDRNGGTERGCEGK